MTDKFADLRAALAAGPTPGPWFHGAKNGDHKYCVYDTICWTDESGRHGETPNMVVHVSPDDGRYLEAAYIAAANPEVIRALLAERDALLARLDIQQDAEGGKHDEIDRLQSALDSAQWDMERAQAERDALDNRAPSYDALLLISQSVAAALDRAGVTCCDDPGDEIDGLAQDAARYRWLRRSNNATLALHLARSECPERMDAEIDAAMAGREGEGIAAFPKEGRDEYAMNLEDR